ncbi:MAG: uroporphyrinogen-III synthase [Flavobacteriales bacterium]|nr:MAG: uroporphyrinogen-III synthase [Flavobacteriales bacterium]
MKIKSILVSQPAPRENSPYLEIAKKQKVQIDFRPFIEVKGADSKDLRTQKIDLSQYTGVVLTSRNAVDHYFRLAEEMRFAVPNEMRYICQSEAIANYLQKHIVYRKRKISFGAKSFSDLLPLFKKFPDEKYLLPSSESISPLVTNTLKKAKVDCTRAVMFRTVSSDITDIKINEYDMLVFFSPHGIKSLQENFKDFEQGDTKIAIFGNTTEKAAKEAGLKIDIKVPSKENPSMTMAIDNYIKKMNK